MNIDIKHLDGKPEVVGQLDNSPVFKIKTKGGLCLLISKRDGRFETLAASPHIKISKKIAKKYAPEISWLELAKSEESVSEEDFNKYDLLTQQFRK
jgi:hypothetical protein